MKKRTKIIITISPKLIKKNPIETLVKAGADILRINTKYMPLKKYSVLINELNKKKDYEILIDIKDRKNISQLKNINFDYLAISFAENPKEIQKIKRLFSKKIKIISKIESKKGVNNIDKLISVSDGIMIARGDLGNSFPIEKIPLIQKLITLKCNKKNKFSITATEMMISMLNHKRPSRAEVTDITNAILEGSDALLLAEETAIGKNPILAIKTMSKIIIETEKYLKDLK